MTGLLKAWHWLVGSKVGQAVALVAALLFVRARIRRNARDEIEAVRAAETAELQQEMRDANAESRDRPVIDRLRDGYF